jgi:hypothetical protein
VLAHDMPLLMHGSGDVQPCDVHPESVRILSELTADYIANLVQAAMDAHEILNDGPQRLPPPPLSQDRAPPKPSPPNLTITTTNDHNNRATPSGTGSAGAGKQAGSNDPQPPITTQKRKQKRPRTEDEFWDEPLPEPKIKGKSNPPHRNGAAAGRANVPQFEGVPIDEWVGVTGVDFWETSRARKAHVSAPSAITTPSFIFPICHDVGLYGKVLDVQSARRAIAPVMVDKILMDMVQTEDAALRRHRNKRRRGRGGDSNNGGGDGDDDNDDPDERDLERKDGATWPGLEYLLPVHVMNDIFGGEGGSSE